MSTAVFGTKKFTKMDKVRPGALPTFKNLIDYFKKNCQDKKVIVPGNRQKHQIH